MQYESVCDKATKIIPTLFISQLSRFVNALLFYMALRQFGIILKTGRCFYKNIVEYVLPNYYTQALRTCAKKYSKTVKSIRDSFWQRVAVNYNNGIYKKQKSLKN